MSPRRRLRTRYEPDAKPPRPRPLVSPEPASVPAPATAAPAIEELAREPAGTGQAAPATIEAVPSAAAEPVDPLLTAPAAEPLPAPPAAEPEPVAAAAAVDPLLTSNVGEPAPAASTEPPAATGPALMPVRPSADVIEEWARAFEQPVDPEAAAAAEAAEARRRHAWRRIRALLTFGALAILAFITGLFVFNNFVMPRLIHGVGQVTVPDLTNLTVEQAEQALRPLGLRATRAGERFDPSAPRGFILDQDPIAGSTVRGRKHVSIVVSLGEEYSSVPELFGESVRAARLLLERAGLQPGVVVQAPSEEAGEGLVAGSDPGAEAVLQRNTPVHLLVSTGPGPESYVMPDLLGREIGSVRRQLEAIGFRVERSGSRTPVGTIVAQTPAPGARITRANVIQLTSSGRIIR